MLELCASDVADPADVEFDEYVPVTVTWPAAHRLLDQPGYVTCQGRVGLLELKFHPSSGHLVEAVLVSARGIEVAEGALVPTSDDEFRTVCWSKENQQVDVVRRVDAVAYDDCLVVALAPDPVERWVGSMPVLFGQGASGEFVAMCVQWDSRERRLVLEPGI
ncbi:MAG: hypothetical protein ACRDTJ_30425 [Pseudonocardiaceae bacterium]